jgi:trans-aconitate 2-methyltransferase
LVADITGAALVVGLDMSESFLRSARRRAGVAFACADATCGFPTRAPDLVYCRLLLAHLPDPQHIVGAWAGQLRGGGLLLLDEVEWIRTNNPVLARYEEIVTAMVGFRGAHISVGPYITGLGGDGWRPRSGALRRYGVATADAARMYAMNLTTWRHNSFVVDNYDAAIIDDLATGLAELTTSTATGEIEWGLRQVAYERTRP